MNRKTAVIDTAIFIIYVLLQIYLAVHHEGWRDEAQAWVIARNCSFAEILGLCSSEGHPCLWLFILRICSLCGLPYRYLSVISISIMAVAALLLLRKSPFSRLSKIVILLSPVFFYYNPVICRIYAILVLLIVLLCVCWPKRREHPILYGLIVALLFQSHILIAGLAIGCLLEILVNYKSLTNKKSSLIGFLIPLISLVCLFFELRQPRGTVTFIQVDPAYCLSRLTPGNIVSSIHSVTDKFDSGMIFIGILVLVSCLLLFAVVAYKSFVPLDQREKARDLLIVSFCGVAYYWGITVLVRSSDHAQLASVFWMLLLFLAWTGSDIAKGGGADPQAGGSADDGRMSLRRNIVEALFFICCLLAVPQSALIDPIADVKGPYSGGAEMAAIVEETVPDGSVIAVHNDLYSTSIAAYLYDSKKGFVIWDIDKGCEFKIHKWGEIIERIPDDSIYEKVRGECERDGNIYYIFGTYAFDAPAASSDTMTPVGKNSSTNTWDEYYQLYELGPSR